MYFRWKSFKLCLIFILHTICDADVTSDTVNNVSQSRSDGKNNFNDANNSFINEINEGRDELIEEEKFFGDTNTVVEAICRDFKYPVKTRLELTSFEMRKIGSLKVNARFRRDDNTTGQINSAKDYMSDYYARRKAIMDNYKLQQKVIMERLKKTKSLIAESRKLNKSKKNYLDRGNATQRRIIDHSNSNIVTYGRYNSTVPPNRVTNHSISEHSTLKFTIFNNTQRDVNESFVNPSYDKPVNNSTEIHLLATTLSPIYKTLRPLATDDTKNIERPDIRILTENWSSKSTNDLIPQNEVDFNLTDDNTTVREERGNDTMFVDLAVPSTSNDSALDQLEEMFLWDVPAGDETIPRSDASKRINDNPILVNPDSNSTESLDSLRFMVEIKSSPELSVNKNIKNVQTDRTTYRNSTHEIVEVNGVVNSIRKIVDSSEVIEPNLTYINSTIPEVVEETTPREGGAKESEWCELCSHDYRWGNCEGTLFYQHNIFLRNRGPSAIDAIFGMNVQGPVDITCVEAIRFNKTRGIVTLHSGGPTHDFAKLRIRGFEGEGFSYIMKVWGVSNDQTPTIDPELQ